jgi:hypothetical protein
MVQTGWTGHSLGLGTSFNPAGSVHASLGVNIAGVNVGAAAGAGSALQIGASIGSRGVSVSVPFVSFSFSLSPAGGW